MLSKEKCLERSKCVLCSGQGMGEGEQDEYGSERYEVLLRWAQKRQGHLCKKDLAGLRYRSPTHATASKFQPHVSRVGLNLPFSCPPVYGSWDLPHTDHVLLM